jgi:hypothetical protein
MIYLLAVTVSAVFGGVDQYLGSISAIPWLPEISLLSAPWLVLPFVFACTQRTPRRAIIIAYVATTSALIAYFIMTLTPMENVHLNGSLGPVFALLHSEAHVIVGAAVTSPLYGYLGFRWRTQRAWMSAVLVGGAICLEPLASASVGRLPQFPEVWGAQIAIGLLVSGYFVWRGTHFRRELLARPLEGR